MRRILALLPVALIPLVVEPGVMARSPESPRAIAANISANTEARSDRSAEAVVRDYVGLYTRDTLDQWKKLFHPGLVVAFPGEEGTARTRGLEAFFKAQKNHFASGRKIGERLENVRVDQGNRIARVSADFIFSDDGKDSTGKLGLHLVETRDGWKITAIVFSYDDED
jgi:hypothetical protein